MRRKRHKKINALKIILFLVGVILILSGVFFIMDFSESSPEELIEDEPVIQSLTGGQIMESLFSDCYHNLNLTQTVIDRDGRTFLVDLVHERDNLVDFSDEILRCTEDFFINLAEDIETGNVFVSDDSFPSEVILTLLDLDREVIEELYISTQD